MECRRGYKYENSQHLEISRIYVNGKCPYPRAKMNGKCPTPRAQKTGKSSTLSRGDPWGFTWYFHNCMYAVRNMDISDTGCPIKTHLKWKILTHSLHMQYFQLQTKNFNETPKCWLLILVGCKYICGLAKFHLQPCQTYVWPTKWVIL